MSAARCLSPWAARFRAGRPAAVWAVLGGLLVGAGTALAQAPSSAGPLPLPPGLGVPSQYVRQYWRKGDGPPQNMVTALLHARNGYVWFGTQEGLVRFDGTHFAVYKTNRYPGLCSNDVTALLEDRRGHLWVGTSAGLSRLVPPSRQGDRDVDAHFVCAARQGALPDEVRALHEDRHGALWVGTLGGLVRFTPDAAGTLGAPAVFTRADGLPDPRVLTVTEDARGALWVGTPVGVARLDPGRRGRFAPATGEPAGVVRALHRDAAGTLWVGSEGGLGRIDHGRFTFAEHDGAPACAPVTSLASDTDGQLWVGTEGGGICALVGGRLHRFTPERGFINATVRAVLADRTGGVWVGTDGGLARLHRGPFLTLGASEGLPADPIYAVLEDRRGALWAGIEGGPLTRLENGRLTTFGPAQGLPAPALSLHEGRDGTLWAGTDGGGLCRLDPNGTGPFRCVGVADGLPSDVVTAVYEDRDGTVWAGTDEGVGRVVGGRAGPPGPALDIHRRNVTVLTGTRDGAFWVGSVAGGLTRLKNGRARTYGVADSLTNVRVLAAHEDERGTFWVGLLDGGLCRLDPAADRFRCYTQADGLLDPKVLQVLSDRRGSLWIGSNQGFFRIRLADLDAYDAGRIPTVPVAVAGAGAADGLRNAEGNGGTQPSAWRTRDGRLLFSTMGGVAVADPAQFARHLDHAPPVVHVEVVRAGDRLFAGALPAPDLAAAERDVRFTVAAIAFSAPDRVQVQYRLDGYEETWQTLDGTNRTVSYSNLAPGAYTFRVRARNGDGVWSTADATYDFRVTPYFYETWWFYLLCVLAVVGGGVALYRLRVRALKRRQTELEGIVAERTGELRARERELEHVNENLAAEVQRQLDVILAERRRYEGELIAARDKAEESARLKEAILNNMSHEIRTPITAILGFSEILAAEAPTDLQEFVQYIDENGKRLLHTLNGVLDLSRIETEGVQLHPARFDAADLVRGVAGVLGPLGERKGVAVRLDLASPCPVVADRFCLERVVTNLVSNALKFTEVGSVTIGLRPDGDAVVLDVADTGIGMAPEFLPQLFEAFKQESDGLSRRHEGSGLGLALVRRFVDALGGTISVASAKGEGTTFTLRLPNRTVGGDGATTVASLPDVRVA